MRRIAGKVLRGAGYLFLLLCALAAYFALLRGGTSLRFVGQFFTAAAGGPILAVLTIGALLAAWRWRRTRERLALVSAILSGLGAAACAVTLGGYVDAARRHGVTIDMARIFWPGPFGYPEPKQEAYVFDRYQGEEAKLLVYRPAKRADGRSAPILVYIHGGGWIVGDAADRGHDLQWFARQGYLVIAINYTLSSDERHLWNVTQPQIGCALAWIGTHGPRLGGDVQRIALIGESAGGTLVLNSAGLAYRGRLPSRCGGVVPQVKAVISVSPPTDLVALYAYEPARKFAVAYTGGAPRQYPDRYATVSPMQHVREPAPPLLFITGLDDGLVLPRDIFRYADAARAAGQHVEMIPMPRAGHCFEVIPGSVGHQILMKSSDVFLKRQGLAP